MKVATRRFEKLEKNCSSSPQERDTNISTGNATKTVMGRNRSTNPTYIVQHTVAIHSKRPAIDKERAQKGTKAAQKVRDGVDQSLSNIVEQKLHRDQITKMNQPVYRKAVKLQVQEGINKPKYLPKDGNSRLLYEPNPTALCFKNVKRGRIGKIRSALRESLRCSHCLVRISYGEPYWK